MNSNFLRFYYRCDFAGDYKIIGTVPPSNINTKWTAAQLDYPRTSYVEIYYSLTDNTVMKIIPLDVDVVNGGAIKAANDHNFIYLHGPKDETKEKHARDYKQHAQMLIDRLLIYGEEMEQEFQKFIDKYPLSPVVISEDTKILG